MGHHTLQSADEDDRLTTYQTLRDMIGIAWRKYAEYAAIPHQEIIVGGNFDGTLLWKRRQPEFAGVDELICGQCNISTFARRFLLAANIAEFRRLYRQGLIYAADLTTVPWTPSIMAVAVAPVGEFHDELIALYDAAIHHYDHVVGPAEHA